LSDHGGRTAEPDFDVAPLQAEVQESQDRRVIKGLGALGETLHEQRPWQE